MGVTKRFIFQIPSNKKICMQDGDFPRITSVGDFLEYICSFDKKKNSRSFKNIQIFFEMESGV